MSENKKANPEQEALAETAELDEERKPHYAHMNEANKEHRGQGKVG